MGGKKKEKMKDLRAAAIKDEQLKELQNTVAALNKLQFDIGVMEVQKHNALHALFEGSDKLTVMQNTFKEQYGTDDINIQDGTINYKDDGSSDS
jgi:TolA-binding protein